MYQCQLLMDSSILKDPLNYKYVVCNSKQEVVFECLQDVPNRVTNRCLKVSSRELHKGKLVIVCKK